MKTKILKIKELQEQARTLQAQSYRLLEEADKLAKEVKASGGNRFVCDGVAYKFEQKAKSLYTEPGNRDWLLLDTSVKVIS